MRTLLLVVLCGCGPISFTTTVKGSTTLQASVLGGLLDVFPQAAGFTNLDFNQSQDFKNNKTDTQHVKAATLESLTLRITSPNDQDYAFLDSLQFSAKSAAGEDVVAFKRSISSLGLKAPNPTLVFELPAVDLSKHLRASTMSLTTQGTGRQPNKETTLEATVVLRIGVGL